MNILRSLNKGSEEEMLNIDKVNNEIENVWKDFKSPEWKIVDLMIILVRLVAKILDRLEQG